MCTVCCLLQLQQWRVRNYWYWPALGNQWQTTATRQNTPWCRQTLGFTFQSVLHPSSPAALRSKSAWSKLSVRWRITVTWSWREGSCWCDSSFNTAPFQTRIRYQGHNVTVIVVFLQFKTIENICENSCHNFPRSIVSVAEPVPPRPRGGDKWSSEDHVWQHSSSSDHHRWTTGRCMPAFPRLPDLCLVPI